jgi:hypothetical protein
MVGKEKIVWDLDYHRRIPYSSDPAYPIHRWYLINESQSILQSQEIFRELGIAPGDLVIDPFMGSGTIALQCTLVGADFIGYDILAACVVGSRAKLVARYVLPKALTSFLRQTQVVCREVDTAVEEFWRLQGLIMQVCLGPEIWVLAACLYSSMHAKGTSATALALRQEFARNVADAVYDISHFSFQTGTKELQRVVWGSGIDTDWQAETKRDYRRAFLITSPPFPKTSQNHSEVWKICESAAERMLYEKDESPVGRMEEMPFFSCERYLELTRSALQRLRAFDAEVVAVLECEYPVAEGDPDGNLDFRVSRMAEQLGFECRELRITHYVESPGVICQHKTAIRGSLIYLNCNIETDIKPFR